MAGRTTGRTEMSYEAEKWAKAQRGLGPAKSVLLQLADHYNPDKGCFPSQESLAYSCEISRSTLNLHLRQLEDAGLIRRERRVNNVTCKRKTTRYYLAFEENFSAPFAISPAPFPGCPENRHTKASSHVRNKSASMSKLSDIDKEAETVTESVRSEGGTVTHVSDTLLDRFLAAHPRPRISKREYCRTLISQIVQRGVDIEKIIEAASRYRADNTGNQIQYISFSDTWLRDGKWVDSVQQDVQLKVTSDPALEMAKFWAEKIKSGSFIAPSAIKMSMANLMIQNGLVTDDDLRRVGASL